MQSASTHRLASIDVLRAVAALGVFLFHVAAAVGFDKRTLPAFEALGHTWSHVPSVFSFGATGVTLFFVLSGFCLSLKPLTSGRLDIAVYYRDRFARIYPAYFAALLFSAAVREIIGADWSVTQLTAVAVFLQGAIQDWHFALNGALWSMSTEVQFYLAFPVAFLAFRRAGASVVVWVLAFVLAFRVGVTQLPSAELVAGGIVRSTFLMNTLAGRLLDFATGMVLAGVWMRDPVPVARWSRCLLVPAVLGGCIARAKGPTWLADPALAVMCAVVVAFAITHLKVRSSAWSAIFGRMSYSFFLLHVPCIALASGIQVSGLYARFAVVGGSAFLLALVLGAALYRFVELPAMDALRHRPEALARPPPGDVPAAGV